MFNNSVTKVPMIYIKPDLTFLEFARANSFAVMCEISGTGTQYDGRKIPGVVDKSCNVPNCRPNFCEKTGWYVITLWANWYGYPNVGENGMVKFSGMNAAPDNSYTHSAPGAGPEPAARKRAQASKNDNKGFGSLEIVAISVGILILLVTIVLVVRAFKK